MNFFHAVMSTDASRSAVVGTTVRVSDGWMPSEVEGYSLNVQPPAATTVTTDSDDTFRELRVDLEQEGHDLEWMLSHPRIDETSQRPQPERSSIHSTLNRTEFLLDIVPHCLKASSVTFQTGFVCQRSRDSVPVDIFALETLILAYYKLSIIERHQQLWSVYLDSGSGELERSHPFRRQHDATQLHYWPVHFLSLTIARAYTKRFHYPSMKHEQHLESVKQYLSHLEEQRYASLMQYDAIQATCQRQTPGVIVHAENYVRQHALPSVNIYFETMIGLLKYDYIDRFIQLRWMKEKPTREQVRTSHIDQFRTNIHFVHCRS